MNAISVDAPDCIGCKHFIESLCKPIYDAFPEAIPEEIWQGDVDHHKPYKCDHGIRFEAISQNE